MSEIKCPHCGQLFTVDEDGYAALVRQVRDGEFQRELAAQAARIEEAAAAREQAALAREQAGAGERLAAKEREIAELRAKAQADGAARDARIAELAATLEGREAAAAAERDLAVRQALDAQRADLARAEQERDRLAASLDAQAERAALERDLALERASAEADEARRAVERERDEMAAALERERLEAERAAAAQASEMAVQLRAKDELIATREREIDDIRHMRAELSVKMVGESLEQFCENEFNKLRATGFQSAVFGKDNDAADGSKGDYIYRELDADGAEVVSIMFEMKNEADDSTHRKRNEDHFKKLDADRRAKGCEYAVLVSLLERDSDYYNTGIVDVSYASGYEKMYVIRPQFFIPMITLIRNAALRSLDYRRQLAEVRQQNVDVTNFEEQLDTFKAGFGRNFDLAHRKFEDAIKDIDATIKKLQKIRDELTSSDNNLRLANDKLGRLTVKRLTRKNPTMKAAFAEAAERRAAGEPAADAWEEEEDDAVLEAELLED